ncbi:MULTISPECIES: DNA mismatch endonuclease Vsr [unclassified Methylobacterium]|uniref:DNA mismatch endonuclease Vsr n=1 Tax=unclassified Methylobacterium TaxID=2615210 RepID=UPI001354E660|nr:DNA mismatch endonuclease Vsr [Methylobacterium sp. 2A]
MTDFLDQAGRSALMRRVRRSDTAPELAVRLALRDLGVGYRLSREGLPGRPDVVLAGRRVAVFVHGCFWHGHPDCKRSAPAKSNVAFWSTKIARNAERDRRVAEELRSKGWHVLVIWECATRNRVRLREVLSTYLLERGFERRSRSTGTLVEIG